MSVSQSEDDGVIGYHVTTVTPANMQPSADAEFPSTRILPAVLSIRSTRNGSRFWTFSLAHARPAATAARLRSRAFGFFANALPSAFSTSATSIESRCATTPTYTMLTTSLRSFASGQHSFTILLKGTG